MQEYKQILTNFREPILKIASQNCFSGKFVMSDFFWRNFREPITTLAFAFLTLIAMCLCLKKFVMSENQF